jgi:hypothetical protein
LKNAAAKKLTQKKKIALLFFVQRIYHHRTAYFVTHHKPHPIPSNTVTQSITLLLGGSLDIVNRAEKMDNSVLELPNLSAQLAVLLLELITSGTDFLGFLSVLLHQCQELLQPKGDRSVRGHRFRLQLFQLVLGSSGTDFQRSDGSFNRHYDCRATEKTRNAERCLVVVMVRNTTLFFFVNMEPSMTKNNETYSALQLHQWEVAEEKRFSLIR